MKGKGKIVLVVLLLLLLSCIVFVCSVWRREPNYSDYVPEFKESDFVLARGSGLGTKLFYKTNEDYNKGDTVDFTFVEVNTKSYNKYLNSNEKDSWAVPPEKVVILDNNVDSLGDGYVVLDMSKVNVDCFGVYSGSRFMNDNLKVVDLGIMPIPSDYHYCEDFDWENGMVRILMDVESPEGSYSYTAKVFEPYYQNSSIILPFEDYKRVYLSDDEVKKVERILSEDTDLELSKYSVRQYFVVEVDGIKKVYVLGLPDEAVISGELNALSDIEMIDVDEYGGFKRVVVLR